VDDIGSLSQPAQRFYPVNEVNSQKSMNVTIVLEIFFTLYNMLHPVRASIGDLFGQIFSDGRLTDSRPSRPRQAYFY
jgi:hypothetical protein